MRNKNTSRVLLKMQDKQGIALGKIPTGTEIQLLFFATNRDGITD